MEWFLQKFTQPPPQFISKRAFYADLAPFRLFSSNLITFENKSPTKPEPPQIKKKSKLQQIQNNMKNIQKSRKFKIKNMKKKPTNPKKIYF